MSDEPNQNPSEGSQNESPSSEAPAGENKPEPDSKSGFFSDDEKAFLKSLLSQIRVAPTDQDSLKTIQIVQSIQSKL